MIELFLYTILVYSTSNIIAYSGMFAFFRNWVQNIFGEESKIYGLITCMMCLPTWIGFFFSTLFILLGHSEFSPFYSAGLDIIALAVFLDGIFASGTSWLIHTFQEFFESDSE